MKLLVHRVVWAFLPALPYAPWCEVCACGWRVISTLLPSGESGVLRQVRMKRLCSAGRNAHTTQRPPLVRRVCVRLERDFDFTATE